MDEKLKEVKLAILDKILTEIKDSKKTINVDTIVSLAGIVDDFDKTEDIKKQPKFDPEFFMKALLETVEKNKFDTEMPVFGMPFAEKL